MEVFLCPEPETKKKKQRLDKEDQKNDQIREMGQVVLDKNEGKRRVELLTIIGEVEGHESAPSQSKTTKYEHVLPKLALVEDDEEIEGLLVLLNTVGGDVEAGLAIAEMIASLSIPTVSLVLGGGPFHRRAHGGVRGLFFRGAQRHHGDPSGAQQRDIHRRGPDLPEHGKDPGQDHVLYRGAFPDHPGTP